MTHACENNTLPQTSFAGGNQPGPHSSVERASAWSLTERQWHGRECSAAMLATERLAGVAPELNFREHVTYMPPPSANNVSFETQGRRHQK